MGEDTTVLGKSRSKFRRLGIVFVMTVICLAPSCIHAQIIDDPMPPIMRSQITPATATTTQLTVGVKFNLTAGTTITTGGYYSLRFNVSVPWLLLDLDGVHLPDESENILRLGALYTKGFAHFSFDNRVLVEEVFLSGGGEARSSNILRLRERPRLTYNLRPESSLAPRIYAYAEPTLETKARQFTRVDYAAGFGFRFPANCITDLFYIRETTPSTHQGDVNFFAIQLIYRVPNRKGAQERN
jgi:hypothetical protein